MKNVSAAQRMLSSIYLSSKSVPPELIKTLSEKDWAEFVFLIERSGVILKLKDWLSDKAAVPAGVPSSILAKLRNHWNRQRIYSIYYSEQYDAISQLLSKHSIRHAALKGVYYSQTLYGHPGERPFNDVDLLIERKDFEKCFDILSDNGFILPTPRFIRWMRANYYGIPVKANGHPGYLLDVHWQLAPNHRFRVDMEGIWTRAVPWKSEFGFTLSREDHFLFSVLHSVYNGYSIRWIWLNDLMCMLKQWELDWNILDARAREWHAEIPLEIIKELLLKLDSEQVGKYTDSFTGKPLSGTMKLRSVWIRKRIDKLLFTKEDLPALKRWSNNLLSLGSCREILICVLDKSYRWMRYGNEPRPIFKS